MSAYVRVFAKLVQDNTGAVSRIPVLLTPQGPMRPLVEYFRQYQITRSPSWMDRVAQSVELLMQYVAANHSAFDSAEQLFQGFMTAMYHGTIGGDGHDPSGLYWRPRRTRNANMLIGSVAVTDRPKGATEDRRNGATRGWLKRDSNGVSGCGVSGVLCNR